MMKRELLLAVIPLVMLLLGEGGSFQGPQHGDVDCHYDSTARAIREWHEPSSEAGASGENALFFTPLVVMLILAGTLAYLMRHRRNRGHSSTES